MSYEKIESLFLNTEKVIIRAAIINQKVEFTCENDMHTLIDKLTRKDKKRLYDLVTVGGLLDTK